nr:MAG TPA: hypothetical protein [Caudoviricetes sp.]
MLFISETIHIFPKLRKLQGCNNAIKYGIKTFVYYKMSIMPRTWKK